MREIRFRAWLPNLNKMSYDVTLYANGWIESVTDDGGEWKHNTSDASLMQYTGLKDKNGKEIYEGDILKIPDLYETPENTSMTYNNQVIDFKNFSFQLGNSPLGEDYEYVADECEVIGNIYGNPELFEVTT